MKRIKTRCGDICYVTNNINEVCLSDYHAGGILYAQEFILGKGVYVLTQNGYPIEDNDILNEVKRMDLDF